MRKKLITALIFTFFSIAIANHAHAVQQSHEIAADSRVRTFVYDPNEVFIFTGHYRYQSSIELSPEETIQSVSVGDSFGWQIVPSGSRIFLKPTEPDATTNMTVITDQRIYLFELHAEEAEGIRDNEMVFSVRFSYPDEGGVTNSVTEFAKEEIPDLSDDVLKTDMENYNFNYTVTGSHLISPVKIFDDGEFTYIEFKDKNADVPAIFMVDGFGSESVINYRAAGNYIVIERVASQYTLRHGDDVACIFNESSPLEKKLPKEEKVLGIF